MAFTNAASVVNLSQPKVWRWWEDDGKIALRVGRKAGRQYGQHMTRIGQQCQRTGKKTTMTSTSINPAVTPKAYNKRRAYYLLAGVKKCVSVSAP